MDRLFWGFSRYIIYIYKAVSKATVRELFRDHWIESYIENLSYINENTIERLSEGLGGNKIKREGVNWLSEKIAMNDRNK